MFTKIMKIKNMAIRLKKTNVVTLISFLVISFSLWSYSCLYLARISISRFSLACLINADNSFLLLNSFLAQMQKGGAESIISPMNDIPNVYGPNNAHMAGVRVAMHEIINMISSVIMICSVFVFSWPVHTTRCLSLSNNP